MTDTLPDLERVYDEAVSAAWIALPLDRDPNFNEQDHVHGAGLLAVYRAGQNKWVSVEERLPENLGHGWSDRALVLFDSGGMSVESVFYGTNIAHKWLLTPGVTAKVTHWQPLPEPPQSVTEGAE